MSDELIGAVGLDVTDVNTAFLQGVAKIDPVINDKSKKLVKKQWLSYFPRGGFGLGQGLTERVNFFEGSLPEQSGLTGWSDIVTETVLDQDGNVVADPCNYTAGDILNYGFTTKSYTGQQKNYGTRTFCLNKYKWLWEFQQQLTMVLKGLGDHVLSIWEVFARENYLKIGKKYICTADVFGAQFLYDTTTKQVKIPKGVKVSAITPSILRYVHQFLSLQCPDAAVGNSSGSPLFGLCAHPVDLDEMVMNDKQLRDVFLYGGGGGPDVLVDGYGTAKSILNQWVIMGDIQAARFKTSGEDGDYIVLDRVDPYKQDPTTVGDMINCNTAYLDATYTIIPIFLKNTFDILTPPSNPAKLAGMSFGTQPSYNGELFWLNFPTEDNPLGEKGKYFGRIMAFLKPQEFYDEVILLLAKRCPRATERTCLTSTDGVATAVKILTATPLDVDTNGDYYLVQVTLASQLACEAPEAVAVAWLDATAGVALIAADKNGENGVYTLTFATKAKHAALHTGLVGGTVTCS